MKFLRTWHDLEKLGVNMLTGEACAVGRRLLCDVNEQGRRTLCQVFGLPIDTKFQENWNSNVNGEPAIGSIFLDRNQFQFIAAMMLLEQGCERVLIVNRGEVWGVEPGDEINMDEIREHYNLDTVYEPLNCPRSGLSATHQMTGRSQ